MTVRARTKSKDVDTEERSFRHGPQRSNEPKPIISHAKRRASKPAATGYAAPMLAAWLWMAAAGILSVTLPGPTMARALGGVDDWGDEFDRGAPR